MKKDKDAKDLPKKELQVSQLKIFSLYILKTDFNKIVPSK